MTDLHEAFRSLTDDEPGESRIDPDGAVRASRARSRTRRHRWLAGGVAAALVVGVGAAVVGPRLAPGSSPAVADVARDSDARDDVTATVERAAQALRDLGYEPEGGRWVVASDKIRWSFVFPDPDAPPDDPTTGGTGEPARLTVVLRPDDTEAGSIFCDGPSCGGLVRTQVKGSSAATGYGQTTQDNGDAQQVLERAYADGGRLQLVATGGMLGGNSGGVIPGHPLMVEQLTAIADAIGDPAPLFAVDLPLPDPSVSPAGWGGGRIDCANLELGSAKHLPDDAGTITAAYLCEIEQRAVSGDGTWSFQVVRRIDGDLAGLQAALAPPDADPTDGPCRAYFDEGPPIWVVTRAGAFVVRVPLDECGHAVESATDAVAALPTTVVSEEKLTQLESQTALDTKCSQDWKDMLRVEASYDAAPATPVAPNPPALSGDRTWRVCAYAAEQPEGDVPVGTLLSARKLTADEVGQVNAALAQATYDPTCARDDHTRFALLTNGRGEPYLVALDGCAVQQGIGWWRAPDELRDLLS